MNNITEKIVAHRGESFDAPENSLSAIKLAWKLGIKAVEIDIHLTADNQIVVIHDNNTGRVGDKKLSIKKNNLIELKNVDIGMKKSKDFIGEKIPTLEEVIKTVPSDCKLIVEVKCSEEIIKYLMIILENTTLKSNQLEFISFNLKIIAKIKGHLPNYKALWLLDLDYYLPHWLLRIKPIKIIEILEENNLDGIDVWGGKIINQNFVKAFTKRGFVLYIWTVNNAAFAKELLDYGVDSITTDRAAWLTKELMKKNNEKSSYRNSWLRK